MQTTPYRYCVHLMPPPKVQGKWPIARILNVI